MKMLGISQLDPMTGKEQFPRFEDAGDEFERGHAGSVFEFDFNRLLANAICAFAKPSHTVA